MRNPDLVLDSLRNFSTRDEYKYKKIYRNLYNEEFFIRAYEKLYSKEDNTTKGYDENTIDGFSQEKIQTLIESLKNETYNPRPVRRQYIAKKNGSNRPLGISSFYDKLVEEIVKEILQAIYEESFSDNSHGFRPNRSCHTSLLQVKGNFAGTRWWIKGDINDFFNKIDHHVLIDILKMRIKDEKFIRLIWKFLKAGYMEDFKFHKTYSGTPQGGIISPILSNIYLDKFDKYMYDQFDKDYRRIKYVRYADDFLIGIIGSKEDAVKFTDDIREFLNKELKLELNPNKTTIINKKDKVRFLGYDIFIGKGRLGRQKVSGKENVLIRTGVESVKLSLPHESLQNFMFKNNYVKEVDGKWKPIHRPKFLNKDDLEIVLAYNTEFRGFYQYYKFAFDVKEKLTNAHFLFKQSFAKTLAAKYKTKTNKLRFAKTDQGLGRYFRDGRWGVSYKDKNGNERFVYLVHYIVT